MYTIDARNVNYALPNGMRLLANVGEVEPSRNGPVLVAPQPVCTTYWRPTQRVLFNSARNANPFFHLMEGLWMLAGRRDVGFLAQFVKRMESFSDDGTTLNGAYGYRWRYFFHIDQIEAAIELLQRNPLDRRVVMQMWSTENDLCSDSKDVPCNTHIYLRCRTAANELDLTTLCRSNDAVWGAHGANAVHFTMLQEYIAQCCGLHVGRFHQVSNNYHVYLDRYDPLACAQKFKALDYYEPATDLPTTVRPYPLVQTDKQTWDHDLEMFLHDPLGDTAYTNPFFNRVAAPLYAAWADYKLGRYASAQALCRSTSGSDWHLACAQWLARAVTRKEAR